MNGFPRMISADRSGKIPLHTDVGVDILLEELYKCVPTSAIANSRTSNERVNASIKEWILEFETNPRTVSERQAIVRYALDNPDFVETIDNLGVYPNQTSERERDNRFEHYEGMVRRFETFAEGVTSLKRVLTDSPKPRTLEKLMHSCEEAEYKVEEAKKHLNPEFELQVEGEGNIERGALLDFFTENRRNGRFEFTYVLSNRTNGAVKRGRNKNEFGIESYLREDHFMEGLGRTLEYALERALGKKPFFKKVHVTNGVTKYNPESGTVEGEFHFAREGHKDEGTFNVVFDKDYDDTPRKIIDMARFVHNYQVVSPFEEMIHGFEDTVVELKAISAAAHFNRTFREKGFPSVFPEIIEGDATEDIFIRNMHHPLLAYFSQNGGVVANDVDTSTGQNVKLITGANNNGKTCYMDALGLSQTAYQAGLPIIADEARMRIKDKILTHYVRPGDIKASQSRFAHECARVLELIEDISSDSLILCDELFTGTAPQDGEIVSKLVLDSLVGTGATLFFTTHYHGLGDQFRNSPYVSQLCCKLDHSTDPPTYTYRIKPGTSRDSDGLVVAAQYGVNKDHLPALLAQKERRGDFKLR